VGIDKLLGARSEREKRAAECGANWAALKSAMGSDLSASFLFVCEKHFF
jgi:hypothetical protein